MTLNQKTETAKRLCSARHKAEVYAQLENVTESGVRAIARELGKQEGHTYRILNSLVESGLAFKSGYRTHINKQAFARIRELPLTKIQLTLLSNEDIIRVVEAVQSGANTTKAISEVLDMDLSKTCQVVFRASSAGLLKRGPNQQLTAVDIDWQHLSSIN